MCKNLRPKSRFTPQHPDIPTLMELMICGDGRGMRAMAVRKERAWSSSSSLSFNRSISNTMQFSDPHTGNASNNGCLSKQLEKDQSSFAAGCSCIFIVMLVSRVDEFKHWPEDKTQKRLTSHCGT